MIMKKTNDKDHVGATSHGKLATTSHRLLATKPRLAFDFTEESGTIDLTRNSTEIRKSSSIDAKDTIQVRFNDRRKNLALVRS